MTKTLEINRLREDPDCGRTFEVVSPDHQTNFLVNSYVIASKVTILNEAGRASIDIDESMYFHVETTDSNGAHAIISIDSDPQITRTRITIPYESQYTFRDVLNKCGIPEQRSTFKEFKNMPDVELNVKFEDGDSTVTSIDVDDDTFTKESKQ